MLPNQLSSGFNVMTPWMGQGGFGLLVTLSSGVCRRVHHYGFASFFFGCAFDSACACLAYCHSVEVDWLSNDSARRWFPYGFADRCVKDLVEVVLLSWKRDASEALSAKRL